MTGAQVDHLHLLHGSDLASPFIDSRYRSGGGRACPRVGSQRRLARPSAEPRGSGSRICLPASATLALVDSLARTLIIAGLVFVALGVLLYASPSIPMLGRLPGDIRIERPGLRVYFPITTCLLVSVVLSAGLWLFSKLR